MINEIKTYNKVILVGKIISRQKDVACNKRKAIKVRISIPTNTEDTNIAYVYIYEEEGVFQKLKVNKTIAIDGHIDSSRGQKIIVDEYSFLD